jgi:hypothetical protein
MMLTAKELLKLLDIIRAQHGPGYASDPEVAALQGKLSVLLELAHKRESV